MVKKNDPGKEFIIDAKNHDLILCLIRYFNGIESEQLMLSKGIMLVGEVGAGKSILLKAFSETLKIMNRSFKVVSCQDVVFEYENTGELNRYMGNEDGLSGKPAKICFDELGRETIPGVHYGNKRNVMQHIIAYRYNCWQNNGLLTHSTTNASPSELINIYGEHIADRIKEMFNWITLTGTSKR